MPLRTDFTTRRRVSEDILFRSGTAQIPNVTELQNESEITISTRYRVDSVTEQTALANTRNSIFGTTGYFIAARSGLLNYDFVTITKSISHTSSLDSREVGGWQSARSIDVATTIRHRGVFNITTPTSFATSLNVSATATFTGSSGTRAFWLLQMPIDGVLSGSASLTNPATDSAARTITITSSCIVVFLAYRIDGQVLTMLPEAAWGVYHKTS
jgi:hypothetical protein